MSGRTKMRRGTRFFRGNSEEPGSSASINVLLSEHENPDGNGYVTLKNGFRKILCYTCHVCSLCPVYLENN